MVRGLKPEESGGGVLRGILVILTVCVIKPIMLTAPVARQEWGEGLRRYGKLLMSNQMDPFLQTLMIHVKSEGATLVLKRVMNQVLISWIYLLALGLWVMFVAVNCLYRQFPIDNHILIISLVGFQAGCPKCIRNFTSKWNQMKVQVLIGPMPQAVGNKLVGAAVAQGVEQVMQ